MKQQDWEFVVAEPNRWMVLMEFFQNPDKLEAYMQANCEDQLLEGYGHAQVTAALLYVRHSISDIDNETVMKLCLDNSGAWEDHHLYAPCQICSLQLERYEGQTNPPRRQSAKRLEAFTFLERDNSIIMKVCPSLGLNCAVHLRFSSVLGASTEACRCVLCPS